jgi:hypothetical protein
MIQEFTKKIVDSIPEEYKKRETIDIILDGGIFNGSYLAGALFFVKEMERQKIYKVNRISCYSIGSIVSLLFYIDKMDMIMDIYNFSIKLIGKKENIFILHQLIEKIAVFLPENIHEIVKNRLFISYYNVEKNKKIIKKKYKDKLELLETVRKTCFFPFLLNGELFYNKKYVDGMSPYIFPDSKRKTIYIQLLSYDKIIDSFFINGEKTNLSRIFYGLLDIHSFYLNKRSHFCSYINVFSIRFWIYNLLKYILERILIFILHIFFKTTYSSYQNLKLYKIVKSFFYNFFKEYYSDNLNTPPYLIYKEFEL